MKASEYDMILKEYFDCDHDETRKTLVTIDEADRDNVVNSLASKIYDHIVNKVDEIDYGTIPDSKGDITKVDNFAMTLDCIETIKKYLKQYRQTMDCPNIIYNAIENIRVRRDEFEKCFAMSIEFGMVTYCNLVLAVEGALHILITSTVEFIKNPNNDNFETTINKTALGKTKDGLLFNSLIRFNKSCEKGEFDRILEFIINGSKKNFVGSTGTIVGGIALTGLVLNIVPVMRELIFFFYNTRTTMADYLETQADLLQMNAYNIEHSASNNMKTNKEIAKKQMAIVDKFRKIANFVAIDTKQAEKKTTKQIADMKKEKYKIDDVVDERPSSASAGSLF